jgi:hypothetical protein
MADNAKENREREGAQAMAQYDAEIRAVREKTARLRELRLAHEAANKSSTGAPGSGKRTAVKKKARKKGEKSEALSEWLANQKSEGRSS